MRKARCLINDNTSDGRRPRLQPKVFPADPADFLASIKRRATETTGGQVQWKTERNGRGSGEKRGTMAARGVDLSSIMPLRVPNGGTIENTRARPGHETRKEPGTLVCTRATRSSNMQKVRASYGNKRFIEFARGLADTGSRDCESPLCLSVSRRTFRNKLHRRSPPYRKRCIVWMPDGGGISEVEFRLSLSSVALFRIVITPCFHPPSPSPPPTNPYHLGPFVQLYRLKRDSGPRIWNVRSRDLSLNTYLSICHVSATLASYRFYDFERWRSVICSN